MWTRGARVIETHRLDAGITDMGHAFGTLATGRPAPPPPEVRGDLRPVTRALNPVPLAPDRSSAGLSR